MPESKLNRRKFLKATSAAGVSLVGIGTANARESNEGSVRFVSMGLEHKVDAETSNILVQTVDQVKGYRVDEEQNKIHIRGRPTESMVETFRKNHTVVGFSGYSPLPSTLREGLTNIVTELGNRYRILKEIIPVNEYRVPRINVKTGDNGIEVSPSGKEPVDVPPRATESKIQLPRRNVTVKSFDGGETSVSVTPNIRIRNYGELSIIDETNGGGQ